MNICDPKVAALHAATQPVVKDGLEAESRAGCRQESFIMASVSKLGAEILVNTAVAGAQDGAKMTALSNGGFVVTWTDGSLGVGGATGDNNSSAVKAQVFAADGTRVGLELLVNTATAGFQSGQQVTALSNGGFVVTWEDGSLGVGGATGDNSVSAIKAQMFAADGTRVGSELLVNTAAANVQGEPEITALANGRFVVTWHDASQGVGGAPGDTDGFAVKAQVFAADGTRVSPELLVNSATEDFQGEPQIAALSNGGFVVIWQDLSLGAGGATGDSTGAAVKAQVFQADGTRVGSELLVNSATADSQAAPQITALSNGGFVVTWRDLSLGVGGATGDSSSVAVKAQVFQVDGTRVGPELLVNTATVNSQDFPQITALANGRFVVTWEDKSQGVGGATGDSSSTAVKAQVFAADGSRIGSELLVNTATVNEQVRQQTTALVNGAFVVTWTDQAGDSSGTAVKAQAFLADGTRVGSEVLVNSATENDQDGPQIAALSNGGFVVSWDDLSLGVGGATGDGSNFAVKAQVFAISDLDLPTPPSPGNDGDGNGLFDTPFYLSQNPDVEQARVNALDHFNASGFREGRDPNGFFDTSGYLAVNKDVAASGVNPIDHFHTIGWKEGRDPSAHFDTTLYLIQNPDVAAANIDPLEHFLRWGFFEGRQAFAAVGQNIVGGFDAQFYLFHNPDVAAAGVDALTHFNSIGWIEGRNPNAFFDTAGYLSHYTDVAAAGINPLQHYIAVGWTEGRDPSATFDTLGYLAANPDVAAAHINPLDHFLQLGIFEGRQPVNDGVFF
jgi:hypothetical protein